MNRPITTAAAIIAGVSVFAFSWSARSGDLNPPAGAVGSTGHTLTEIFEAIEPGGSDESRATDFAPVTPAGLVPYARIDGATQGLITDLDVTQSGREDTTRVYHYEHDLVQPYDAASGLPTGKRQHKPFAMTLVFANSTPKLYAAMTSNESLAVALRFWRPSPTGQEEQYYTIELTDAHIVNMTPRSVGVANGLPSHEYEISLTYRTISWTYEDGGVSHADDWETP